MGTSRFDIEKLAEDYVNSNYDKFTQGDEYAALEKRYSQAGRKAADDTIGLAAARTGGLASSYAVSAGAQAYGGYMEKLEEAARALYDSERAEKADKLGVAQELSSQSGKTAQEQIHMALAAGKTVEEIADLHPDWISDSGYDPDYWNYYDSASTGTRAVEPANMTLKEIEDYIAAGNYPTAAMAAAYEKITGGAPLEGYYGDEYAETYDYIKKNKGDSAVIWNYLQNVSDNDKIAVTKIMEDLGIDINALMDENTDHTSDDIIDLILGKGRSREDISEEDKAILSESSFNSNSGLFKMFKAVIGEFNTYQEFINKLYAYLVDIES